LKNTLHALALQETTNRFEVVVASDGRDADTESIAVAYAAPYSLVWKWNPENLGPAATRNLGVHAASGEIILFLDDDCIPTPGWINGHLSHHIDGKNRVVLGRFHTVYDRPPHNHTEAFLRELQDHSFDRFWQVLSSTRPDPSMYWIGLNSSLPRALYMELGEADCRLRVNEDMDMAERAVNAGVEFLFDSKLLIAHCEDKDLEADRKLRAPLFAQCELLRALELGSEAATWPTLGSLHFGDRWYWRFKDRLSWHFPAAANLAGRLFRWITNATGSRSAFKISDAFLFAPRYWQAVRSSGITLGRLREITEREWKRRQSDGAECKP
jgi:glycosyltransferase involved in cell wall biosynthesis